MLLKKKAVLEAVFCSHQNTVDCSFYYSGLYGQEITKYQEENGMQFNHLDYM